MSAPVERAVLARSDGAEPWLEVTGPGAATVVAMLSAVEPPVALPAPALVRVELFAVEAVVRRRAAAPVVVTLTSPRAGELGVVEDLLVDRAFPDVPGEATVVATFADLPAPTPELVLAALAAAAVARCCAVPADAVAAGLRAWSSADPGD